MISFKHHQDQQQQDQENMSNLTTSASGGQASVSSGTRNDFINQHFNFAAASASLPAPQSQPLKRKRNLPGNPDPEAEVIVLTPKTLMATNRFVCEICNKGFQRDQNLQLHRRGHNLPWKLKQRSNKDVIRKKVYVCPEPTCVHHDPSRALGDLTGIKKHFSRKHGEKKWKCEKCSKRYAVQSDWKAHSKTCGTREYRCDCGTIFSRRDSFITHRAFCDALAEESTRATVTTPPINPIFGTGGANLNTIINLQIPHDLTHQEPFKKEELIGNFNLQPWLGQDPANPSHTTITQYNSTMSPSPSPSPHMSATALLQKAAQMGATMSSNKMRLPGQDHVSPDSDNKSNITTGFGLNLSSREEHLHVHGLSSFVNNGSHVSTNFLLQEMMSMNNAFDHGQHGFGLKKSEEMTRDFLGLRGEIDILNMAGLGGTSSSATSNEPNQTHKSWQG